MQQKKLARIITLGTLITILAACGQSGQLYLPPEEQQTNTQKINTTTKQDTPRIHSAESQQEK